MPSTTMAVHRDPEILGGLGRNHSLDEFLDSLPTVTRAQAVGHDGRNFLSAP